MVVLAEGKARDAGIENCSFSVMDIYDLPCNEKSFDVIVAAHVLHLLENQGAALANLKKFLKPGGVMLLPIYCHGATLLSHCISRIAGLAGFRVRSRWSVKGSFEFLSSRGLAPVNTRCIKGLFPVALVLAVPADDI